MTVKGICHEYGFTPVALPSPEREIKGGYIGDLLSWVMGRASEDNAWITIMSNINIVAVASLTDVACIILAEGVTVEDNVKEAAQSKGVNIISSTLPAFETAAALIKTI